MAIKVSVLEGDFAQLSTLGLPLPLCIQLQISCLKLDEAMWTAKSSSGGFSVNLFWPPEEIVQSKKRRKRRRRAKASATTNKSNQHDSSVSSPVLPTNPLILSDAHHSDRADSPPAHSETVQTPKNSTLPKPESITPSHSNGSTCSPVVDLAECTAVSYEVRDGVHGFVKL